MECLNQIEISTPQPAAPIEIALQTQQNSPHSQASVVFGFCAVSERTDCSLRWKAKRGMSNPHQSYLIHHCGAECDHQCLKMDRIETVKAMAFVTGYLRIWTAEVLTLSSKT
jgi:hypothetical protein